MDPPPALKNVQDDDVLLVTRCIYGLVQSARQYYKKTVEILRKIGFVGGDIDPCLYYRKSKQGTVFIAIYVDDNLLVGDADAIQETINYLKKEGLVLKIEDDLKDYLSCEVRFLEDKKRAWLGQPHLIKNLKAKFGNQVKEI